MYFDEIPSEISKRGLISQRAEEFGFQPLQNLQDDNDVLGLLRACEGLKVDKVPGQVARMTAFQ